MARPAAGRPCSSATVARLVLGSRAALTQRFKERFSGFTEVEEVNGINHLMQGYKNTSAKEKPKTPAKGN